MLQQGNDDLEQEMNKLGLGYDEQQAVHGLIKNSGYTYEEMLADYSRAGARLVYNKLSKKLNIEIAP
jgi:hypothetical protein